MDPEESWHKSSFSGSGNCVEIGIRPDAVLVRHTRNRRGASLAFSPSEWLAFLQGVRAGEFDIPQGPVALSVLSADVQAQKRSRDRA